MQIQEKQALSSDMIIEILQNKAQDRESNGTSRKLKRASSTSSSRFSYQLSQLLKKK